MEITKQEARDWYELNSQNTTNWVDLPEKKKVEAGLKTLASYFEFIEKVESSASSVLFYMRPGDIGLDKNRVKEESRYGDLTAYVLQKSVGEVVLIFNDDDIAVSKFEVLDANGMPLSQWATDREAFVVMTISTSSTTLKE